MTDDQKTCTCGRKVRLTPSPTQVKLTALSGKHLDGVLMARCKCGLVHMRLPDLPPEQKEEIRRLLEEGKQTGISLGYSSDDARGTDPSPSSPARRARVARPVSRPFRPGRR